MKIQHCSLVLLWGGEWRFHGQFPLSNIQSSAFHAFPISSKAEIATRLLKGLFRLEIGKNVKWYEQKNFNVFQSYHLIKIYYQNLSTLCSTFQREHFQIIQSLLWKRILLPIIHRSTCFGIWLFSLWILWALFV